MASDVERVLGLYPPDCQPLAVAPIVSPESFSGARLWRVNTPRGTLCLRQWPRDHPRSERLEFIQAVLWHVDQEGFRLHPVPIETRHCHGYVRHAGHLWELTPWLPGSADYRIRPSAARLRNALMALAGFHRAAESFPLPETARVGSPGILERLARLDNLLGGRLAAICSQMDDGWPEFGQRTRRLIPLFAAAAPDVLRSLQAAQEVRVDLQPCIRDIWHAHVLFVDEQVSGIVDFGSLRPENVAADVARLLGSLAADDPTSWEQGLAAYQSSRPLSHQELRLMTVFDRSSVLMSGIQWLEWVYVERRIFNQADAVLARVDEFLARLEKLTKALGAN